MKGGRIFLLIVSGVIACIGISMQLECLNALVKDVKVLGQVYGAVGATIFGSLFFGGINFTKPPSRSSMWCYTKFAFFILIAALISFLAINKSEFVIALAVSSIGFLTSGLYESGCQFDKKKRCSIHEVEFKKARFRVEMEEIERQI